MLILTRKIGESICIGDDTTITITSVNNQGVRVGVDAPKNIEVHREEIYLKIKEHEQQKEKPVV